MAVHRRRMAFVKELFSTLGSKLTPSHIVDHLNSTDANKALSAKQGKILHDMIGTNTQQITSTTFDMSKVKYMKENINLNNGVATLSHIPFGGQVLFGKGYVHKFFGSGDRDVNITNKTLTLVGTTSGNDIDVDYYYYDLS